MTIIDCNALPPRIVETRLKSSVDPARSFSSDTYGARLMVELVINKRRELNLSPRTPRPSVDESLR